MIGLQRAHREPIHGGQDRDAELFGHQPVLRSDVIGDRHEIRVAGRVRRTGGHAIGKHIDRDDAPPVGIKDAVGSDEPSHVRMLGAIAAGIEDQIVPGVIQGAVPLSANLGIPDDAAFLRSEVAKREGAAFLDPTRGCHPSRTPSSRQCAPGTAANKAFV